MAIDNIAVNVIVPGLVEGDENMLLNPGTRKHPMWHIPAQRGGRPAEIASAVSFLASDNAAYINGATLRIDGGIGNSAWDSRSTWARDFYQAKIAAGDRHSSALRKLGNRWLELLWHCLRLGVAYDEAVHTANRNHALARTQPAEG